MFINQSASGEAKNSDFKSSDNWLMYGDCLERMKEIPSSSVDFLLTDPPYGTTACKWDSVINLKSMWSEVRRIVKPNAAVVFTAQQPFTSILTCSNLEMFKYQWYWRKSRPAGFTNAKLKPLKDVEDLLVFSTGATANGSKYNMPYHPQGLVEVNSEWNRPTTYLSGDRGVNPARVNSKLSRTIKHSGYPRQVLDFANPNFEVLHPTQKPIALMEYMLKTYTNEGETCLDFTMGSGTTGVACANLNRKFIGIELDEKYFTIAKERILKVKRNNT